MLIESSSAEQEHAGEELYLRNAGKLKNKTNKPPKKAFGVVGCFSMAWFVSSCNAQEAFRSDGKEMAKDSNRGSLFAFHIKSL